MTDDNSYPYDIEDIMVLAMNGADIEHLVIDIEGFGRMTFESLIGNQVTWSMTDGTKTMRSTYEMYPDGSVRREISREWV